MGENSNVIFLLLDEIHDNTDDIYEAIMDKEDDKVIETKIDETIKHLKELKESVIKKDDNDV